MNPPEQSDPAMNGNSVFISHLAHELRTPLNGALGFAQLMASDERHPLNKQQLSQLSRLESAGHDMLALLDDLLNLSQARLEALPELGAVDLLAILHTATADTMPFAEARRVNFQPELPELDAVVRGHAESVHRIVVSLLNRAIAASEPGGTVAFTVLRRPGRCRVVVSDNGPCLPQDLMDRLFEPFADTAGSAGPSDPYFSQQSTGLDLAISKALTEQMGGSILVWRESGHGTTIEVELERADSLPGATQRSGGSHARPNAGRPRYKLTVPSGRGPVKVLYVEDDRLNSLLVKSALDELPGCEVYVAESGEEAWEQLHLLRPDVLLSDLNLPGCSGLDLVARVRASDNFSALLCIAISADAAARESALYAGYDAYWSKPVDLRELIGTIRQLCQQREAAD